MRKLALWPLALLLLPALVVPALALAQPPEEGAGQPEENSNSGESDEAPSAPPNPHGVDPHGTSPHGTSPHGTTPGQAASPHGGAGHGGGMHGAFGPPQVAQATPSAEVPAGSIQVIVLDEAGAPVAGAPLDLGRLDQDQDRTRVTGRTDARGRHRFSGLDTGEGQAYRVNLRYEGATYSCTPFRLPPQQGYEVTIRRLPVTHEDRRVLLGMGRTILELHDERLKVIQHADLINVGEQTYVFPEEGTRIALPEGFLAFQGQRVMGDQRVEEVTGEGLRIAGSLPPGRVQLAWSFDLPLDGESLNLHVPVPFRTVTYQVIFSRPPEGLRVEVEGMPELSQGDSAGTPVVYTQLQRRPGDPAFEGFDVRLSGIPGPGPQRWLAAGLASLFLLLAALFAFWRGDGDAHDPAAQKKRKESILGEIAALEEQLAQGEIGPRYAATQRELLRHDLAMILLEEETSRGEEPTREGGARRQAGASR